jgi:hypothetical protein
VSESILDQAKAFISDIESFKNLEIKMRKRDIEIRTNDFVFFLDSTGGFKMGFIMEKEDSLAILNTAMEQVFQRLDELKWKRARSPIAVTYGLEYLVGKEYDPFSKLVGKEILKELFRDEEDIRVANIRLSAKWKKNGEKRPIHIVVTARKKGSTIENFSYNTYRGQLPYNNMAKKAFVDSKSLMDRVVEQLTGERP